MQVVFCRPLQTKYSFGNGGCFDLYICFNKCCYTPYAAGEQCRCGGTDSIRSICKYIRKHAIEPALQDSSETAAILSESVGTNESKPVGCTHHYRIKVVSPTCTERGYTEHVCTVCGQRFSDAFTPAGHQYGKYLCEICGAPDPSVPLHSLCAWLRTYGTLNANGTYRSISYGDITIYTSEYFHDRDYIYIDKAVGTENSSEIFRIFFDSSGECTVLYSLSYPHSSVSASAAQSIGETGVLPITALEKYHNSTDNGKTQADYVQLLNRDLVPILRMRSEIYYIRERDLL